MCEVLPMIEIKFRAWDKTRKRYYYSDNHASLFTFFRNLDQRNIKNVELWTGLKDKNGKDIFDGDVVKLIQHTYYFTHTAIFEVTIPKIYLIDDTKHKNSEIEVMGNKFENPELLK